MSLWGEQEQGDQLARIEDKLDGLLMALESMSALQRSNGQLLLAMSKTIRGDAISKVVE